MNSTPLEWQAQGAVLNAWAAAESTDPNRLDFAKLLDERHLRGLGPAYPKDTSVPRVAAPKHFRFHARRHMTRALGWWERRPLPDAVNNALYERWPSALYMLLRLKLIFATEVHTAK